MKYLTHLLRLFLGITFIISGMIKLNDPMGFSFKLEDYFAPNVLGLPFLFSLFQQSNRLRLLRRCYQIHPLAVVYQRHSAISGCPHHLFMGTGLYKTHQQRQTTSIYHPTIGNFLQYFCILCI